MKLNIFKTENLIVFKSWSRKKTAILQSLGVPIKIAVLSFSYSLLFKCLPSYSQQDTINFNQNIDLEEVSIVGKKMPDLYSPGGRQIEVITRKEIDKINPTSVQDLLKSVSITDIRQRGPKGIQADISLRGGSFDQVMILLNGVNITDPQTGHHSLNLPVNIESINRIEILHGSGARAHGANAFSGVINIITSPSSTDYISLSSEAGSNQYFGSSFSLNMSSDKSSNLITGSHAQSNGYIKNTDFNKTNLFYHGKYTFKPATINFIAGYTEKKFGAFNYYHPYSESQYEETTSYFANLNTSYGKNQFKHSTKVGYRQHYDRYEFLRIGDGYYVKTDSTWHYPDAVFPFFRELTSENFIGPNYHSTSVLNTDHTTAIRYANGSTVFGVNYQLDYILSNKLGLDDSSVNFNFNESDITKSYKRNSFSIYFEQNYTLDNLIFSGGVMSYYNSDLEKFKFFPGLNLAYYLNNFKISGSYNYTLRVPTFTDMFLLTSTNMGNLNLLPEKAHSFDAGIKYATSGIKAEISGFARMGEDIIDWVRDTATNIYVASNISELKSYGIESDFSVQPADFPLSFDIKYSYITSERPDNIESKYALDHLKHNLVANVHVSIIDKMQISVIQRYSERAGEYDKLIVSEDVSLITRAYKPQYVTDLNLTYNFKKMKAHLNIENVFNNDLTGIGGIPLPGRWITVGIASKINL